MCSNKGVPGACGHGALTHERLVIFMWCHVNKRQASCANQPCTYTALMLKTKAC